MICDILHNSAASVPSAWKFRQEFQSRLGIVFDHLGTIYHSFPGRITAETFKKQITSVIDVWEDWIVFSPDFTSELRACLDGASTTEAEPQNEENVGNIEPSRQVVASRFKASSFQPAQEVSEAGFSAGASASTGGDEDGEPMDEDKDDLDGEPVDGVDGEPLNDDVDGEPMDDGELDGEPLEDDIDGAPVDI